MYKFWTDIREWYGISILFYFGKKHFHPLHLYFMLYVPQNFKIPFHTWQSFTCTKQSLNTIMIYNSNIQLMEINTVESWFL